jgi:hypothetical protein
MALHGRNEKSILDAPATSQGLSVAPKPMAPANPPVPAGPQVPKPQ